MSETFYSDVVLNPAPEKPGMLIRGVVLSAALALSGCSIGGSADAPPEPRQSVSSVEADAPSSPEAARAQVTFEEFQSDISVSQTTTDALYNASLRLEIGEGVCSGTIINDYLVTASHCNPDDKGITARRWLDEYTSVTDTADSWASINPDKNDLLFASLNRTQGLPAVFFSHISNESPEPGTRMIAATLPGDRKLPVLGTLTYLVEEAANTTGSIDQRHGRRWVLALGPDNSSEALDVLCNPGASGSAFIDDLGHISVLSGLISKQFTTPEEWENAINHYEEKTGSSLDGVTAFCIATPVSRDTFNAYSENL